MYPGNGSIQQIKISSDGKDFIAMEWIRLDNPTMQSDRRVANPYVCLMGGIQPALLDKLLNEQHQQAGLAARFLLSL